MKKRKAREKKYVRYIIRLEKMPIKNSRIAILQGWLRFSGVSLERRMAIRKRQRR